MWKEKAVIGRTIPIQMQLFWSSIKLNVGGKKNPWHKCCLTVLLMLPVLKFSTSFSKYVILNHFFFYFRRWKTWTSLKSSGEGFKRKMKTRRSSRVSSSQTAIQTVVNSCKSVKVIFFNFIMLVFFFFLSFSTSDQRSQLTHPYFSYGRDGRAAGG